MQFCVEKKKDRQVTKFNVVENQLRKLRSYGPSSYASLSDPDGQFVQLAGGGVTCIVEWKRVSGGPIWRAHLSENKTPFEGTQILSFGGGKMNMQPDEILFVDDAIEVFKAFFDRDEMPDRILWRDMSDDLAI